MPREIGGLKLCEVPPEVVAYTEGRADRFAATPQGRRWTTAGAAIAAHRIQKLKEAAARREATLVGGAA